MPEMHSWVEINRNALLKNYHYFCRQVGHKKAVPVLKSNAYGHGIREVFHILSEAPAPPACIAVNYLAEAGILRKEGFEGSIIVVGPVLSEELPQAFQLNAEIIAGCPELLTNWLESSDKPCIHIKFDTGMGRQGFKPAEATHLLERLNPWKSHVKGVSTHFANVEDVSDTSYPGMQLTRLDGVVRGFRQAGFQILAHAASSASSLLIRSSHLDLCRIGISLYGLWPSRITRMSYMNLHDVAAPLEPVLSWHTRVTRVRDLSTDEFVGYGCTFRAPRPMKLAVLSVGYFEGYSRLMADNASYVLIDGRRCHILGRICMNMMMVDVSHVPETAPGDKATLLGYSGGEELSAETLAGWAQTINYEVVTCINSGLRRIVTGELQP